MNIPKFPDDFYSFHDGVNVSDEEINEWIQECIREIEETNGNSCTISSGNTCVTVNKFYYDNESEDYYYDIRVSKGYWQWDNYDEFV